jgi:branched-chain amino acid transport system ATP-binding protein
MADALLTFRGVRAGYGDAVVLDNIDLEVPEQGSLAVLGRNGVGKSTLLLTIMGYTAVRRGAVSFKGQDITAWQPHRRARAGIGWVAQEREIFPSLTVEENLTVAARSGRWGLDAVYELFPRLRERKGNMGNQLSGGEQQMLAIARALMTNPSLLLLDEPLEGLAPVIVEALTAVMVRLRQESRLSIVLVEQNSRVAFEFSDRSVVLDKGRIVFDGASTALRDDPERLAKLIGVSE